MCKDWCEVKALTSTGRHVGDGLVQSVLRQMSGKVSREMGGCTRQQKAREIRLGERGRRAGGGVGNDVGG